MAAAPAAVGMQHNRGLAASTFKELPTLSHTPHPTTLTPVPTPSRVQGAIYLDGGLEAVRQCYLHHFPLPADPLTLLQPDGTGGLPSANAGSGGGSGSPWE